MEAPGSETTEQEAIAPGTGGGAEGGAGERDTTDEWRIEPAGAPATVAELEARIEVALVTARSAEEAALEIGAAGLEAADQARHAAGLAERASAAAARAASEASAAAESAARSREAAGPATTISPTAFAPQGTVAAPPPATPPPSPRDAAAARPAQPAPAPPGPADFLPRPERTDARRPDAFEERVNAFRRRAERVMVRLQKLEAGADPGGGPSEVVRLR